MRVLLSTIGSRGDVQPLVALALELQALGHEVRLCVPPDFQDWIRGLGLKVTPIGPELRGLASASPSATQGPPSLDIKRRLVEGTVAAQFEAIPAAAEGCDLIVAATALQIAARSVAELMGIPYVFVAYCPTVLPSLHHHPIPLGGRGSLAAADAGELWRKDARGWNETWGDALNARRASLGLAEVSDVRGHILTDDPWLAADQTLAPWPDPADRRVVQTGAWMLPDAQPLPPELEAFLDAGEPPVYLGFGSMRAPQGLGQTVIRAARSLGRRVIVSRGWAELSLVDDAPDGIAIAEVNQQALFGRVAAVVHHGGAGTTTAAARAGAPQVVIPQMYDQHYWAERVQQLGVGTALTPGSPSVESLAGALERALRSVVSERARSLAQAIRTDGAKVAAKLLVRQGATHRSSG